MYRSDKQFMKNPATAHLRIYVGNLAENVVPEDLDNKFNVHGVILGLVLNKGFGFIQFETEEQQKAAIAKENGTMFHGRKINVKPIMDPKKLAQGRNKEPEMIAEEPQKPMEQPPKQGEVEPPVEMKKRPFNENRNLPRHDNRNAPRFNDNYREPYYPMDDYPPRFDPPPVMDRPDRNDCEIIVVAKILTEYAEYIEQRLKAMGLIVDLLFPNEDVPIGRVLANISSRGCLYAILVMPQNEENRSMTLNILHGVPQEHRNMPIEDAILLITRNFEAYMRGEKIHFNNNGKMTLMDRHPEGMQMLINLLAENRMLSVNQYNKLLKYLEERRELQTAHDGVENPEKPDGKATELQNRILSILNNKSTPQEKEEPVAAPVVPPTPLLNDPSVQKMLDSLLHGDILKNMTS